MKYIIITLVTALFSLGLNLETQGQAKTWESYFNEFKHNDPHLQFYFPPPNERMKHYYELSGKERRLVKRRLKHHYDIRPSFGGYIVGTFQTIGTSLGRTIIYIGTMTVTTIVIAAILNRSHEL